MLAHYTDSTQECFFIAVITNELTALSSTLGVLADNFIGPLKGLANTLFAHFITTG